ncbi:MAG: hypothetical protein JWN62_4532 [Acidimicrobiales bacterium]|nr:hypothetical protein [Acidimicrobiales bacterium]
MTDLQTSAPDDTEGVDDEIVVPWWQRPLNLILLLVGVLVLAAGAGFVVGERHATPDPNGVDIGFLWDMRTHHEQAVEMSLTFISKSGTDPTIGLIAREIAFGQAVESGKMIQLLRQYGQQEARDDDQDAMGWMNEPVPQDRMPGLASAADLDRLTAATGADADALYLQLMIAHHEGGIHMAQYAQEHAATSEVVALAASMVSNQQGEIAEMRNLE